MKFTLSWLKEHLDTDASLTEITDRLTAIGLELEGVENPADVLRPFKIARVIEAGPHPNADKLRLLKVDDGSSRTLAGGVRRAQCAAGPCRRVRPAGNLCARPRLHAEACEDPRCRKLRHDVLVPRAGDGRGSRRHHRTARRCAGRHQLCRLCRAGRSGDRCVGDAQQAGLHGRARHRARPGGIGHRHAQAARRWPMSHRYRRWPQCAHRRHRRLPRVLRAAPSPASPMAQRPTGCRRG